MKNFFGSIFNIVSLLSLFLSLFLLFHLAERIINQCPPSRTKAPSKMFCSYELVDRSKWLSDRPEWIVTTNLKTPFIIVLVSIAVSFASYKTGKYLKKKYA